ncbi:ArnT family glycosyltransferase [Apilactobacillus apinorum]|uniref:Glycosyltransferase family 39 protein n=1 Tax=Apilactobacillus apinorum TaxID=1218495 RepID=A0ABP9ZHM6_9LACO
MNQPTEKKDNFFSRHKIDWVLVIIMLIALGLYGYGTWKTGSANDFYTSAITSMTQSFKNFWYASFDPAGYITVDKPPVALWFMAISAKILGVSNFSVVLPSVLFGVGSVYLMYRLVTPYFGRFAGRIAALVMTITPIVVADSRTNNMDATLIYFLLLAIWMLQKSINKNNMYWLIGSFATIGFAFNIKMLQAFMIIPGMLLFYWLASKDSWKKKIGKLSLAGIALVVFTLSWPLSVDMTSASNRPYEGGSQHNSVLELAFGYNGTQRLLGQTTGTGGAFKGMGNNSSKSKSNNNQQMTMPNGQKMGNFKPSKNMKNMKNIPSNARRGGMKMGGGKNMGGAGGAFNIGTVGPLRLFQSALGPQISWLLPFAIIGMIAAFIGYADPKRKWYQLTHRQKHVVLWTGWLVPVYGFFSVASFFHPYYTIMLAPAIAALAGLGLAAMIKLFKEFGLNNYKAYFLPVAIVTTAALQAWYVSSYYTWLTVLIIIVAVIASAGLLIFKAKPAGKAIMIIGLLSIAVAPSFWSLTPTLAKESAAIPTAGPDLLTSGGNNSGGIGNGTVNTKLLNYLTKHQGNAKYLFATADSGTAAPYIIKTKKAVMAMGGFNGTDPAMTLSKFKQLVKSGQVKYYLDEGKSGSTNNEIVNWIKKHAKKVNASEYGGSSNSNSSSNTSMFTAKNRPSNMTKPSGKMAKGQQPKNSSMNMGGGPSNMSNGTLYDLSSIY